MITIEITEKVNTHNDMVNCLNEIVRLIELGCTSGYKPNWNLSGIEEPENEGD